MSATLKRVPRPEGFSYTPTTKVTIRNFHSVSYRHWPLADSRGSGSKALHKHNTMADVIMYTRNENWSPYLNDKIKHFLFYLLYHNIHCTTLYERKGNNAVSQFLGVCSQAAIMNVNTILFQYKKNFSAKTGNKVRVFSELTFCGPTFCPPSAVISFVKVFRNGFFCVLSNRNNSFKVLRNNITPICRARFN